MQKLATKSKKRNKEQIKSKNKNKEQRTNKQDSKLNNKTCKN